MFVGVGASKVRDLFKTAKENAPCIVFVDEIDVVGRQKGTGIGGGNDEREKTLNLTEMDGFEGNTGIIVVAATNRADILDSALLRPGRFDRQFVMQVSVDVPDIKGRTDILEVHADLANLLNEAAILAGRRAKTVISSKEIDDSIDRIVVGVEGTVMTDSKSKSLVAYDEVGHAVCGTLTAGHDAVQKMVTTFGMSEIGPWSLMDSSAQSDVIMRMMARNSMSEKLAEDIDSAVKKLSDSAYEIALSHNIRNNREAMDKIV
ncbi:hypothetical protein Bca101_010038 [Brassica carinata]